MKKLFVQVKTAVGKILCSSAYARPADTMIGVVTDPEAHTMHHIDPHSTRSLAAVKIVNCINKSISLEQLDVTAKLIELFEKKYGTGLPLRRWWTLAMFDLTYYPKNA